MNRVLPAYVGDANDPAVYTGTPFYSLQAGSSIGVINAGLSLETTSPGWSLRRQPMKMPTALVERTKAYFVEDNGRPAELIPEVKRLS